MAKNSLETEVENWFIELFRTDPAFKGKTFRHPDAQADAKPNMIVIEATQGEDLLEGARGPNGECRSKVEVTARYQSTTPNDIMAGALQRCIRNPKGRLTKTQQKPGFYLLIRTEQITGDRSNTSNIRTRQLTIPVEAGLIE